jgi:hypothetical protein
MEAVERALESESECAEVLRLIAYLLETHRLSPLRTVPLFEA